jgi:hypothetical protein
MAILAGAFLRAKSFDNSISVAGSSKQAVVSDSARWLGSFSRTISKDEIKSGYGLMKKDEMAVSKFFKDNGLSDKDISISPVMMNEVYKSDNNAPKEYSLYQSVEIKSADVYKIRDLAKNIQALVDQDILFSTNTIEYYYSKLPEARVSLLSGAIKDAKDRASKIADSSGQEVGSVKSVSMGIVQVLAPNSIDISDYGSYDTSSIDKEVMVTVKAVFGLER